MFIPHPVYRWSKHIPDVCMSACRSLIYKAADLINVHTTAIVVYRIGRIKIASFVDSSLKPNHKQGCLLSLCPESMKTWSLID